MAGHACYTALLDACVLYPATVADALLSLCVNGLFAAKWTVDIEAEFIRNLVSKRPELREKIGRRRDHMRAAVPDWEVAFEAYHPLLSAFTLPDPDDRHVLAAAVAGHADCIVTANLADFPTAITSIHGIEIIHPDDFIVMQLDIDPVAALAALKAMRARMRNPPRSPEAFAQLLERSQLVSTAQRVRRAASLI